MSRRLVRGCQWLALLLPTLFCLALGCEAISNRLTRWNMLGQEALDDPLQAVGGDGILFQPRQDGQPLDRAQIAAATPQELVAYYAPIFVQQRVNSAQLKYPYPAEVDLIGEARLKHGDAPDKFEAVVTGQPKVYALLQKRKIGDVEHVQITYTAWYPAHARMKLIDLEGADIDSIVLRVTLDVRNVPLFYETIAACGCFHKVFVARRVEEAAKAAFGSPEKDKKYAVEKTVKDAIVWEVAGVVDEPPDQPRRPVVFVKAGDHKVIGMGSAARLRMPRDAVQRYELAEYSELYAVPVDNGPQRAPFFDLGKGGKVWGAQR
jgi:hypothetical protein